MKAVGTGHGVRELAAGVRAGSWPRTDARPKQRAAGHLRERWQVWTGLSALALALGIFAFALAPSPLLKTVSLGMVVVAVLGLLWSLTSPGTATATKTSRPTSAPTTDLGGDAEQWTAIELRRLRRPGWRVVNQFLDKCGDIDHVLIGPGGVYAVETKWMADRDSVHARQQERRAAGQAQADSRSMNLLRDMRLNGVRVQPLVVLWGAGIETWDEEQRIKTVDGVPVLTGPAIGDWVQTLPTDLLDREAVEHVWTIVETQASSRG